MGMNHVCCKLLVMTDLSMITGSEGVSFLFPQDFFSQHRLKVGNINPVPVYLNLLIFDARIYGLWENVYIDHSGEMQDLSFMTEQGERCHDLWSVGESCSRM